jgi:hypothetical protein
MISDGGAVASLGGHSLLRGGCNQLLAFPMEIPRANCASMISNGGEAQLTFQVGIFTDKLDDLIDQRAVLSLEKEANNPIRILSIFLFDPGNNAG